jgi:predicted nucleic-acid-binding Zn-ribbon protein
MADESKKPLSNIFSEFMAATKDREQSPEYRQLVENLAKLAKTDDAAAQMLAAAVKADALRQAAESGIVDSVAANAWFHAHWPMPRPCPVCKTENNWGLTTNFAQISLGPPGPQLRTRTSPFVVVTCRNCGNSLFFNALVIGQLPKDQE